MPEWSNGVALRSTAHSAHGFEPHSQHFFTTTGWGDSSAPVMGSKLDTDR